MGNIVIDWEKQPYKGLLFYFAAIVVAGIWLGIANSGEIDSLPALKRAALLFQTLLKNSCSSFITATLVSKEISFSKMNSSKNIIL
jgi:hypothetical protein